MAASIVLGDNNPKLGLGLLSPSTIDPIVGAISRPKRGNLMKKISRSSNGNDAICCAASSQYVDLDVYIQGLQMKVHCLRG